MWVNLNPGIPSVKHTLVDATVSQRLWLTLVKFSNCFILISLFSNKLFNKRRTYTLSFLKFVQIEMKTETESNLDEIRHLKQLMILDQCISGKKRFVE
jgi:hypothetical protein